MAWWELNDLGEMILERGGGVDWPIPWVRDCDWRGGLPRPAPDISLLPYVPYAPYGVRTFFFNFGYDDEKLNLDKPMTRRFRVVARRPHQHHNLEVNSPYYDVSEATGCRKCQNWWNDTPGTRGLRATPSRVCQQEMGQTKKDQLTLISSLSCCAIPPAEQGGNRKWRGVDRQFRDGGYMQH